ncbi:MAG: dihydroorotase [Bacteroidetes bacterium]|nr:MAG: dihydroorotase [Bacteroidota bacterium]MBL1145254.1 dihydroorotase [Bacteroidota bacterium]NOG58050.1 dihydroorotase [Bacteroidota bacterium]
MKHLIQSATIVDPTSKHHLKQVDLIIENGIITTIGEDLKADDCVIIQSKNLHLSKGWIDLKANYQDPGFEYKEDIESGSKASASGGFTKVCISPLSLPVIDSKAQVDYVKNKAKNQLVDVLPYACISKDAKGKELAEMYDMHQSGAIAFTDDKRAIRNPNLLLRALLYTQSFDGLILSFPHTHEIAEHGVMNEGNVSTHLGLNGIPELAEDLMCIRDIHLTEYSNGRIHFSQISSSKSIELIKLAKKQGLNITCDIASYSIALSDEELYGFDSRLKTLPPLRSKETIKNLIKGIKSGVVDAICSDHTPEDIENKKKEFDYAAFGIINAQTAFSSAFDALNSQLDVTSIIQLFTEGPAKVLKLNLESIEQGNKANLTLFDPELNFTFTKDKVISKSKNSPFFKKELKGKVIGVFNNKKVHIN